MALVKGNEIPTIDVEMVTIKTDDGATEIALKTANKIAVEPQVEEIEPQKLIVKGQLIAQKKGQKVLTGNRITMTDNVINPQLLKVLQGGTIVMDSVDPTKVKSYTPPVSGSTDKGKSFELCCYSAQYNAAGIIVAYEKITYPNCTGNPFSPQTEDGVFRAAELVIDSAPDTGEAPYGIEYVATLPIVS